MEMFGEHGATKKKTTNAQATRDESASLHPDRTDRRGSMRGINAVPVPGHVHATFAPRNDVCILMLSGSAVPGVWRTGVLLYKLDRGYQIWFYEVSHMT